MLPVSRCCVTGMGLPVLPGARPGRAPSRGLGLPLRASCDCSNQNFMILTFSCVVLQEKTSLSIQPEPGPGETEAVTGEGVFLNLRLDRRTGARLARSRWPRGTVTVTVVPNSAPTRKRGKQITVR